MAPLVSVIIPAYNASATLRRAVASVLEQPVRDVELLLIDDGSVDDTPQLCQELAASDTRIKIYRQENQGISAARNCGLRHAIGQWIAFCDDDDLFLPGALQRMLQAVKHSGIDVVRGDYRLLRAADDGAYREIPHKAPPLCTMSGQDGYGAFLAVSGPQFVWNAIYRRSAIAGLYFEETCRFGVEDFIFNAAVYAKIDGALCIPDAVYCHYEGTSSTSSLVSKEALAGRIAALRPWLQAEHTALIARCLGPDRAAVWASRCVQAITFLMHQFRDAKADASLRKSGWDELRDILRQYPVRVWDAMLLLPTDKKAASALLLYKFRLEGLYDRLPRREESL